MGTLFVLAGLGLSSVLESGGWRSAAKGLLADPYIWRTWRFTMFQAALSTALSLLLALPVSFALVRRRFPGRALVLYLSTLSFVLPPIVVVFGLIEVFGRRGWVSALLSPFGVESGSWLFGLPGILIAHVFFNAPLAVRYFTSALATTPRQTWRLSEQLQFGGWQRLWLIDWPQLRAVLPGTALLIFLLCFTSFALVLGLGGGPSTNSLEVSIYEALRFEANFSRAALLSLVQMVTLVVIAVFLSASARSLPLFPSTAQPATRPGLAPSLDWIVLALFVLFIALPLASVFINGAGPKFLGVLMDTGVQRALLTSLIIALLSAVLSVIFALSLNRLGAVAAWFGLALLIFPGFVFVTGLFVAGGWLMAPLDQSAMALGPLLVVIVNALAALPFAIRAIGPVQRRVAAQQNRLSASLGLSGPRRWLLVDLPLLRPALGLAFGLSAALSIGDFGVIAFFGSERFVTLPLLLHRGLSSYRFEEGGALALLLLLLALGLFALGAWIGGKRSYA